MSLQGIEKYFIFIKNRVSTDWKDLAWCLGFETPDISNIDAKHLDEKSRCRELLQEWHKRKGKSATIHVLMEALQTAQLKHVVDNLKDEYPELEEELSPAASGPSQEMTASEVPTGEQVQTDRPEDLLSSLRLEVTRLTLDDEKTQKIEHQEEKILYLQESSKAGEKKIKELLKQVAEQRQEIQQLQDSNKTKDAKIEELTSENTKLVNQVAELTEIHKNTQRQEMQQLEDTNIKTTEVKIEELTTDKHKKVTKSRPNQKVAKKEGSDITESSVSTEDTAVTAAHQGQCICQ